MDSFGIPKKINRHALKALYTLQANGVDLSDFSLILESVKNSMKNLVPVKNLNSALRKSLRNMAELGVIEKNGSKYSLRNAEAKPSSSKKIDPRVFKMKANHRSDGSNMNPKAKRKRVVPFYGMEMEKVHKRARLNKVPHNRGNNFKMPKSRMSYGLHALGVNLEHDTQNDPYRNWTEDEDEGSSGHSSQRAEPKLSFDEFEFDCTNEMDPNNTESAPEEFNWDEQCSSHEEQNHQVEQYPERHHPERHHPERQHPERQFPEKKGSSEDFKKRPPSPNPETRSGEVITALEPLVNAGADEFRITDGGDGSLLFSQRNVLKRL